MSAGVDSRLRAAVASLAMATRPTDVLTWDGTQVDPGAPKKAEGWLPGDEPPAEWLNYWQALTAQWVNNLDEALLEVNGGLRGSYVLRRQFVCTTGLSVAAGLSNQEILSDQVAATTQTNTTVTTLKPTADPDAPFPYVSINVLNAAVNQGAVVFSCAGDGSSDRFFTLLTQVSAVFEVPVYMTAVGANGVDVGFGLTQSPDSSQPANSDTSTLFVKQSADVNWQAKAANGTAASTVDTSVAPVANVWQRFRVEFHGSLTPVGVQNGSSTALYYVDDVLLATITGANVPSEDTLGLGFTVHARANGTGPAADFALRFGPVKVAWQPFLF